jgi:hypothetical protein
MFPDWLSAFGRCDSPYQEWARRRAEKKGMRAQQVIEMTENGDVDITADFIAGKRKNKDKGFIVFLKQDLEAAAFELSLEVNDDPISFDAAKYLVSAQIREGRVVPAALQEWCSGMILGEITRSKLKGKPIGATVARDKMIYWLINELLHALDLKPTSADRDEGKSACHAVATGFSLLGLNPRSYQATLEIWQNRDLLKIVDSRDD